MVIYVKRLANKLRYLTRRQGLHFVNYLLASSLRSYTYRSLKVLFARSPAPLVKLASSRPAIEDKYRLAKSLTHNTLPGADPCPPALTLAQLAAAAAPDSSGKALAERRRRRTHPDEEIVLAWRERGGPIHWPLGEIALPSPPSLLLEQAQPRARRLALVLTPDNQLLRRQDYDDDRVGFIDEWYKLATLSGKAPVAPLHQVAEKERRLYTGVIGGRALGDLQGEDEEALRQAEAALEAVHAAGIAGLGRGGLERIVVAERTGAPYFTDLSAAVAYPSTQSMVFRLARDRDREEFNRLYGRRLLTEASARSRLAAAQAELTAYRDYAPIDFGFEVRTGAPKSIDSGTGRWEFFNKDIVAPLVRGKRVLDLGSNNGSMPLLMLRAGAREVVGVEMSAKIAAYAQVNRRVLEWLDMRSYAFRLHNCDMLEVLRADWGQFDVVTAYCSLYYLSEEEMGRVVRRCAEGVAPVMILQGNTGFARGEARSVKATAEYLRRVLEQNGYGRVEVHAPAGFSRPILIGRIPTHP